MPVRNRGSNNICIARHNRKSADNALQSEYLGMESEGMAEIKRDRVMYSGTSVYCGPCSSHNLECLAIGLNSCPSSGACSWSYLQ